MHFLIFAIGLYFLPAIIAAARQTNNATGILLVNIFLGWTVIGWFVALVMSIYSAPYYVNYQPPVCRRGW